ncbi:saccharopine dehydrogenase NADP-binding domain-containing protein [bacterium]|nr:saccharopine dehydrogenase NADP-binding domain-containing protein [bacterium]
MENINVVVLGAGMVGGFIARELARLSHLQVTVCDHSAAALAQCQAAAALLEAPLSTNQADLADMDLLRKCIEDAQIVVGAVPGWLGYQMLQTVIEAGKHCVDISFFPEDALSLDEQARQRGVCAVVDCGVMPGLGGMLGVRLAGHLAQAQSLSIQVGGLPVERRWPLQYKAPFSPVDVIEEYVRPARVKSQGEVITVPALSGVEQIELPGIGSLESFYTDGLRTLLSTMDLPDMEERTLRYPGTAQQMRFLRDLGLFDDAAISVRRADGEGFAQVVPAAFTARLLERHWRLNPGEREFTFMRVEVGGLDSEGREALERCDLLDFGTAPSEQQPLAASSMSRTTGYPAIIATQLMAAGRIIKPGVHAPETLAREDELWQLFHDGMRGYGVSMEFSRM